MSIRELFVCGKTIKCPIVAAIYDLDPTLMMIQLGHMPFCVCFI